MERHKDQPFAILGINTDGNAETFRTERAAFELNYRSIFDGGTDGPLTRAWGVQSFPTVYVIDAEGVIRARNVRGEALDAKVAELLAELEAEPGR